MPGNEVGDRVHNFFAQDNLPQGQHHTQALDGNWPVLSSNLWPGSQRQVGPVNTTTKNYNLQQSGAGGDRGQLGNTFHGSHALTVAQSSPRPDCGKSQTQSPLPNFNNFMYGNQFYQTRQDETNFLAMDTNSDQRNLTSRTIGPQQVSGPESQGKSLGPPASLDFFGGQQQMSHQQISMLQSLQHQPSGLNDIQLQQQVMLMKIQELQRQQQLQQMDARQQGLLNQMLPFMKQSSGGQPASLINGSVNSDTLSYHWGNEVGGANWLQRNPQAMQGSSNGLVFSPNQGQVQRMVDLAPQQVEQSLYGVPISGSRGSLNQYPQMGTEKPSVQQQASFGNSFPGNQYSAFPGQVTMQDRSSIARQRFQPENSFGNGSGQALRTAIDMENAQQQQVNSMQRNEQMVEFRQRQEQLVPNECLQGKTERQDAPSRDDVALDPTEERILFGSDDNIWAAFGKGPNTGVESSNLFDGAGFSGFSSIQSGTWSALMQSAVAETSVSDVGLQEEWSGLTFQNNDIPSGNQHVLSCNDGRKQQTALGDDRLSMALPFASGSAPPSGDSNMVKNYQNVMGFQQFDQSSETAQRLRANPSHGLDQPSEDGGRWSNGIPVPKSGAAESQLQGNLSYSLDAESSASRQRFSKPNGWNVFGSTTPYVDSRVTVQGTENSLQHSQNNEQKHIMQREVVDGRALFNSHPGRDTAVEMEQVKSALGSSHLNKEGFRLNNTAALSDSSSMRAGEGSSQFLPNSYQLNSWRNADPLAKSKVGEVLGGSQHGNKISSGKEESRGLDTENSDKQEDSNDSYRSNVSHHTSAGGQKENAAADAVDSRPLSGKQKSSNQMARKNSSRKFQYHPMGNLNDDLEAPHGSKQPIYTQAMNHFLQSKLFGQVPKIPIDTGKGQSADLQMNNKGFDDVHSPSDLPGSVPNISSPFNRSLDLGTQDKSSQSSRNMLELLHKVDQSREHAAMMQAIASEPNAAPEMPQAENSDGSGSQLQRSHSSSSQGFTLQLGPPMQRLPLPSQPLSSQNSLQGVSALLSTHAASETGQKGQGQLFPSSFAQPMPPPSERGENNRPGTPGQTGNQSSPFKMTANFSSAFSSGFSHSRGQLQGQEFVLADGQLSRSSEKQASHYSKKDDDPNNRPAAGQPLESSFPNEAGRIPQGNSSLSDTKQISANVLPGKVMATQFSAGKPVPVSQPSTMSNTSPVGTSSKALPNMWSNVTPPQHLLGPQFHKVSSQFSPSNLANVANSTSAQNQGDHDGKQGNFQSELRANCVNGQDFHSEEEQLSKKRASQQPSSENTDLVQMMNESQGKESIARTLSDGSPANSLSTQRDIEAFGRSLKPNNLLQQNYSLLNQMQAMKSVDDDPSNRVLKRMKGPDSGGGGQLVPPIAGQSNDLTAIVGDALVPRKTLPSEDPAMLSFSTAENSMERNLSSEQGNIASQSAGAFTRDGSQSSNDAALTKVDHSKISPQMAPSWFNQYGCFKNGQILPMYDARKAAILKTVEQSFALGKSSSGLHTLNSMEPLGSAAAAVDTNQIGSVRQSAIPALAAEYLSSQTLPSNDSGQHLVISKPKKRKSATSDLDPWYKEVSQGSRNLHNISVAEVEWAKAANRRIAKVEEDVELMEDGPLMLKPKRRLLLTTQLMQQLFRPPPAAILSMDANLEYESVAYSISRFALGDACSMVSLTNGKSNMLPDSINRDPGGCKTSESVDNERLLKVIDNCTTRARKLEDAFLRLDRRVSVLDLIVECQDLEKFSVINRFAKFHGRGQADNNEAASSSDAAANTQKPHPQRYVTALPLPRNLPTRVQCCSL